AAPPEQARTCPAGTAASLPESRRTIPLGAKLFHTSSDSIEIVGDFPTGPKKPRSDAHGPRLRRTRRPDGRNLLRESKELSVVERAKGSYGRGYTNKSGIEGALSS